MAWTVRGESARDFSLAWAWCLVIHLEFLVLWRSFVKFGQLYHSVVTSLWRGQSGFSESSRDFSLAWVLYPLRKIPATHWTRGCIGSGAGTDILEGKKSLEGCLTIHLPQKEKSLAHAGYDTVTTQFSSPVLVTLSCPGLWFDVT